MLHHGQEPHFEYELSEGEPASQGVIEAVSAVSGLPAVPVVDGEDVLDPLYSVIDPEALDSLFSASSDSEQCRGQISFSYFGYDITVDSDGTISVTDS